MRLFRRNALGIYAVYAAAMVSGLIVTPILLDAIGDEAFGIWAFIGGITIYLAVLDLGLGPSIVRFTAEARGRRDPEEIEPVASVALVLYAAIGVLTLVAGAVLAWFVPLLIETPADLVWDARISTFLVTLSLAVRFPLGLFYNLLGGQQRFDLQNLGNFVATVLYALLVALLIPRGGGLVLLGRADDLVTVLRLGLPLFWLRRELPELRAAARATSRATGCAISSASAGATSSSTSRTRWSSRPTSSSSGSCSAPSRRRSTRSLRGSSSSRSVSPAW